MRLVSRSNADTHESVRRRRHAHDPSAVRTIVQREEKHTQTPNIQHVLNRGGRKINRGHGYTRHSIEDRHE